MDKAANTHLRRCSHTSYGLFWPRSANVRHPHDRPITNNSLGGFTLVVKSQETDILCVIFLWRKNGESNAKIWRNSAKQRHVFESHGVWHAVLFLWAWIVTLSIVFWHRTTVLKWRVEQERRQNGLQIQDKSSKMTCGTRKTSEEYIQDIPPARLMDIYRWKWLGVATSKMPSANWPIGYLVTYLS